MCSQYDNDVHAYAQNADTDLIEVENNIQCVISNNASVFQLCYTEIN